MHASVSLRCEAQTFYQKLTIFQRNPFYKSFGRNGSLAMKGAIKYKRFAGKVPRRAARNAIPTNVYVYTVCIMSDAFVGLFREIWISRWNEPSIKKKNSEGRLWQQYTKERCLERESGESYATKHNWPIERSERGLVLHSNESALLVRSTTTKPMDQIACGFFIVFDERKSWK